MRAYTAPDTGIKTVRLRVDIGEIHLRQHEDPDAPAHLELAPIDPQEHAAREAIGNSTITPEADTLSIIVPFAPDVHAHTQIGNVVSSTYTDRHGGTVVRNTITGNAHNVLQAVNLSGGVVVGMQVGQINGGISINGRPVQALPGTRTQGVRATLTVGKNTTLLIRGVSVALRAVGRYRKIVVHVDNGSVIIDHADDLDVISDNADVTAAVRLADIRTDNGNITLREAEMAEARTDNGNVNLINCAVAVARTDNGNIQFLNCAKPEGLTDNGNIHATGIVEHGQLRTDNGNINFTSEHAATIRARSSTGTISYHAPHASVDARSAYGHVTHH